MLKIVTSQDAKIDIQEIISNCQSLKTLWISGDSFPSHSAKQFQFPKTLKNLFVTLNIDLQDAIKAWLEDLNQRLVDMECLDLFNFSVIDIRPRCFPVLTSLLQTPCIKNTKSFQMYISEFVPSDLEENSIFHVMSKQLTSMKSLENLKLWFLPSINGTQAIMQEFLDSMPNVKHLNLRMGIPPVSLKQKQVLIKVPFQQKLSNLCTLKLYLFGFTMVFAYPRGIEVEGLRNLEEIVINGSKDLVPFGWLEFVKMLTQIKLSKLNHVSLHANDGRLEIEDFAEFKKMNSKFL